MKSGRANLYQKVRRKFFPLWPPSRERARIRETKIEKREDRLVPRALLQTTIAQRLQNPNKVSTVLTKKLTN